jgi:hypothetical protein
LQSTPDDDGRPAAGIPVVNLHEEEDVKICNFFQFETLCEKTTTLSSTRRYSLAFSFLNII